MTQLNNDTLKTLRLYVLKSKPLNRDYCTLELHCDRRKYTTKLLQSILDLVSIDSFIDSKIVYKDRDIDLIIHFKPSKKPCDCFIFSSRRLKEIYSDSAIFSYDASTNLFNI